MKFKIGIIDDDKNQAEDFVIILESEGVDAEIFSMEFTPDNILNWISEKHIDCILVDYKLAEKTNERGTEIIYKIEEIVPDFPAVLLTSYPEGARATYLVNNAFIYNKTIMEITSNDTEELREFDQFIETINGSIKVYKERMGKREQRYEELLRRKSNKAVDLSSKEREEFISLHRLLKGLGYIEEISSELIEGQVEGKIDLLISKLDNLLEN